MSDGLRPRGRPSSAFVPDEVLDGRYRMVRKIGRGTTGEVWRALHIDIDKEVAIKVLLSDEGSPFHEEQSQRFLREARASPSIKHRGVVDITDFGRTPTGAPYFVMELLVGRTLQKLVDDEGPMDWPAVRRLVSELSSALEAAHALGIIHCDLKPANIFAVRDGDDIVYKVIDFGIAKFTMLPEGAPKLTRTGMIHGTPKFMSPEQGRGRSLDGRSDVYALGCVAYYALTGRPPFDGDSIAELVHKHLTQPPIRPSELRSSIPPEADDFILRALEKHPDARFQDMADLRRGLDDPAAATSEATPSLRAHQAAPRSRLATSRLRSIMIPGGLIVLLVLIAVAVAAVGLL